MIFGLEDGLVSTLGVVTGVVSGTEDRKVVVLSGFILILVEALSMAAGTFLSNQAERDQEKLKHKRDNHISPIFGAAVMGVAYMMAGAVPLAPYLFFPLSIGLYYSVGLTVITLFAAGWFKGVATKTPPLRCATQMVVVSLSAALLGYLVGVWGSQLIMLP